VNRLHGPAHQLATRARIKFCIASSHACSPMVLHFSAFFRRI
jgi:hypothetical protein